MSPSGYTGGTESRFARLAKLDPPTGRAVERLLLGWIIGVANEDPASIAEYTDNFGPDISCERVFRHPVASDQQVSDYPLLRHITG
jgi:hypothetical protein